MQEDKRNAKVDTRIAKVVFSKKGSVFVARKKRKGEKEDVLPFSFDVSPFLFWYFPITKLILA